MEPVVISTPLSIVVALVGFALLYYGVRGVRK